MAKQIDAWGAPERYYAARVFDGGQGAVSTSWEQNLNLVAPGCDDAVRRAVDLWNLRVRTQLAAETGFQLKGRQVPIQVVPGLPPPLAESLAGDVGIEAVMLNRPLLDAVVGGTEFMAGARDLVRNRDGTTVGAAQPGELDNVRNTAKAWLEWADENDVSKRTPSRNCSGRNGARPSGSRGRVRRSSARARYAQSSTWCSSETPRRGFACCRSAILLELSLEAIVVARAGDFPNDVVDQARARLENAGADFDRVHGYWRSR